jgi:hypothetical protein
VKKEWRYNEDNDRGNCRKEQKQKKENLLFNSVLLSFPPPPKWISAIWRPFQKPANCFLQKKKKKKKKKQTEPKTNSRPFHRPFDLHRRAAPSYNS